MNVLVFEPKYVGHCLGFAAITADAFAELGCPVTLVVPRRCEGSPQAQVKLVGLHEGVSVRYDIDVPVRFKQWENARFESAALDECLRRWQIDHLVVPTGDFVLSGLLINGRLRRRIPHGAADLILHNCQQAYPGWGRRDRLWRFVDRLAVSAAFRVHLHAVDPFATSQDARRLALWGRPVRPLPHPYDRVPHWKSQVEARRALRLPENVRLIGSVGDLGARKGTELLMESYARSDVGPDTRLVLFGLTSPSVKEALSQHARLVSSGHILCRDRFLTDEEFLDFFAAMDVVWMGYPRQIGIASILLYAADAGRPVLASNYGCINWLVSRYGLGRVCAPTSHDMAAAIADYDREPSWRINVDGVEQFLGYHNTQNFACHLTRAASSRLQENDGSGSFPGPSGQTTTPLEPPV